MKYPQNYNRTMTPKLNRKSCFSPAKIYESTIDSSFGKKSTSQSVKGSGSFASKK